MNNYEKYLPHIDAADGIKRVMNNKKLYTTMLGKFKLAEMTEKIAEALDSGDPEKTYFATHALKGTAINLGFPTIFALCNDMEQLAKDGGDALPMLPALQKLAADVAVLIAEFIENEGV
jgi:HPt (histidine-containing phosphotransfer) domain-containing protein